jgi:hypothetical protein
MTYNKELSDESIKFLYEFTPLFGRLKDAILTNKDPFSILSSCVEKLRAIDDNLLSVLAQRNRSFLLDYIKNMLKEEGVQAHFVLPKYGVPLKLMSALAEIMIAIFRKYPDRTFMVDLESSEGGYAISSIVRNVKFEELQNISLVRAIATLDGVLSRYEASGIRITLPNIFGREKFLKIMSKNGVVAIPLTSVSDYEKLVADNAGGKKQNIEICLGTDKINLKAEIAGQEFCLRSYPKLPLSVKYFKGVILSSLGTPVPVLNIQEMINEGIFEWLY